MTLWKCNFDGSRLNAEQRCAHWLAQSKALAWVLKWRQFVETNCWNHIHCTDACKIDDLSLNRASVQFRIAKCNRFISLRANTCKWCLALYQIELDALLPSFTARTFVNERWSQKARSNHVFAWLALTFYKCFVCEIQSSETSSQVLWNHTQPLAPNEFVTFSNHLENYQFPLFWGWWPALQA